MRDHAVLFDFHAEAPRASITDMSDMQQTSFIATHATLP